MPVSGVQQLPALQVWPEPQPPQEIVFGGLQPSLKKKLPQPMPASAQTEASGTGVQPQTLLTPPPPQLAFPEQAPQSSVPPQPSLTVPQFFPRRSHVNGVHASVEV